MQASDELLTIAELAIALAGFSGVVVAFAHQGKLTAIDRTRFTLLLSLAMGAAVVSFAPSLLHLLGLTGEAIQAVLTEAFTAYEQLTKVTANTDARNHSSSRLLEKLGFTHEGTLRSGGVTAKGELVDGAIYGLLRSEWRVRAG